MSTMEQTPRRRKLTAEGPFAVEGFRAAGLRPLSAEEVRRFSRGAELAEGSEVFDVVRERERESLRVFFGKDIDVPPIPDEITPERYEQWKAMGLELHYVPREDMTEDKTYPGWKKKPTSSINLFNAIKDPKDKLAADTLTLHAAWIVVDAREKPQYQSGNQMYADDMFKDTIEELRKSGVIGGAKAGSRFSISWDELNKIEVKEKFANILGVSPDQLRLPRAIEWNFLGNAYYPRWGETNTWEWFEDSYQGSRRLVGGSSVLGGLSLVSWGVPVSRRDDGGFRPLVVFPA